MLFLGGLGTSVGSTVAAKPVVKIRCGECSLEDIPKHFDESAGCQDWCATCGDRTNNVSKYCLALCNHCQQDVRKWSLCRDGVRAGANWGN